MIEWLDCRKAHWLYRGILIAQWAPPIRLKNESKSLVTKYAFEEKYENEKSIVVRECYVVSSVVLVAESCKWNLSAYRGNEFWEIITLRLRPLVFHMPYPYRSTENLIEAS